MPPTTNKLSALFFLFVALIMATTPIAEGQLGGVGGIGDIVVTNVIRIIGNISCSLDGSTGVLNGVAIRPFPDAQVQLQCGGKEVASTRTNTNGVFSIILDPLSNLLSTLLSSCNIVVISPLSTCNANLPSTGVLVSGGLSLLVSAVTDVLIQTINLVPGALRYIPIFNIN